MKVSSFLTDEETEEAAFSQDFATSMYTQCTNDFVLGFELIFLNPACLTFFSVCLYGK
jgi:hypothetical protein